MKNHEKILLRKSFLLSICNYVIFTKISENFTISQKNFYSDCKTLFMILLFQLQYNTIQYNTTQHNTTQHNTIQYNTYNAMHCNAMQCNTIQCNAMQYSTVQYSTEQYNTIQYNTIQCNTIKKTHSFAALTRSFSKVLQRVNKNPYKALSML